MSDVAPVPTSSFPTVKPGTVWRAVSPHRSSWRTPPASLWAFIALGDPLCSPLLCLAYSGKVSPMDLAILPRLTPAFSNLTAARTVDNRVPNELVCLHGVRHIWYSPSPTGALTNEQTDAPPFAHPVKRLVSATLDNFLPIATSHLSWLLTPS